ncbi:MAG: arylesterase [Alphaproteobacteria bacterium]|nr:arylesterase [Alphaproteobacteria bacterium]
MIPIRAHYGLVGRVLELLVALWLLAAIPALAADPPRRILALGDSLTAGYGLRADEAFPAVLERALLARGHAVRVIDAGVSGDTSAAGRQRLGWVLADRPDFAIVELGANDGLRALPVEAMRANLDAILTELKSRGIGVLLAGMKAPANLGADYARAFEAVYPELATRHGVLLYPFFLDGVAGDPTLNQPDGIHPTAAGVARIVERILPSVERLIRGVP